MLKLTAEKHRKKFYFKMVLSLTRRRGGGTKQKVTAKLGGRGGEGEEGGG